MQRLVVEAMRQGAVGVSSSLEYAPAPYASTEELIALSRAAAEYGGIYATHMRSEQEAIMTALEETIRIGREAHIPVEIWHLKAGGVKNFGLMPEIVARIERARAVGRRHRRGHLCVSGLGERPVGVHSALGARWRQRQTGRAAQGPGGASALEAGARASVSTDWDNEWQSVAGPEAIQISTVLNPKLNDLAGPHARRDREVPRHRSDGHAVRHSHRGRCTNRRRGVRDERAGHCACGGAAVGVVLQ